MAFVCKGYKPALHAVGLACLTSIALAQEPAVLPKVEVTGSRIKRLDTETATPIQVVRREDIQRSGASNLRQLLDQVSSATGSLSDIGGSNSFSPGGSSVSLRNLGKQSTLVLLNFRRIAPYPLADYNEVFSNIDSLPLDAIDRVEILKNGGAALYGSDAVAGVINIITRTDFNGLQGTIDYKQASKTGKFAETRAAVTGGWGKLEQDGFNFLANAEFFKREALSSWRDLIQDVNPAYAAKSSGFGTFSTYSYPGNLIGQGPLDGCATVVSGLCRYDRYQRFAVQPGAERANLLVSSRYKVGAEIEGFSELLYSNVKTNYSSAFNAYGVGIGPTVWGDPRTGAPKFFYPRGLPAEHPLNRSGEEIEFRYRFVDGPSEDAVSTDQYRLLTGLRGTWEEFDWESAIGIMGGKSKERQRGTFSDSGFIELIGDYNLDTLAPDFFNKPGGYQIGKANSAAVIDRLFPIFGYTGDTKQYFWDGKLSGEIGKFMGGPVLLAAGAEIRRESYAVTPTRNLAEGDIVGFGVSSSDASRTFGALYSEVSLQPVKDLEIQLAARLDKFPGFSAHVSPKLGIRFQPMPQLLLRGTVEGGFRAPNLTESAPSTKFAFQNGISDPQRCPQATALGAALKAAAEALPDTDPTKALLQARADNVVSSECEAGVAVINANNPNLKPETSRSITAGMVFEPIKDLSFSVDLWRIERKQEIGVKDVNDLLAQESTLATGSLTRGNLADDPTFTAPERATYGVRSGALLAANGKFENLFRTKTSGVDLSMKASVDVGFGRFGYELDAVYLASLYNFSAERNAYGDNLAGRYGNPRWNTGHTFSLRHDGFSHSLRYTYNQSTTLNTDYFDNSWTPDGCEDRGVTAQECRYAAYQRWDYGLTYTGFKNLTLGLHVRNLLNKRPPIDWRDFGGSTGLTPISREDVQGRVFKIMVEYKFL